MCAVPSHGNDIPMDKIGNWYANAGHANDIQYFIDRTKKLSEIL